MTLPRAYQFFTAGLHNKQCCHALNLFVQVFQNVFLALFKHVSLGGSEPVDFNFIFEINQHVWVSLRVTHSVDVTIQTGRLVLVRVP